jgi:hypothetical protein
MNPIAARQLVVTGVATTTVLVVGRAAVESSSLPPARAIAGLGLTFLGLSVLADVAPELAGPLAILVAVSALVVPYKGKSSAQVLLGAMGATTTKPKG